MTTAGSARRPNGRYLVAAPTAGPQVALARSRESPSFYPNHPASPDRAGSCSDTIIHQRPPILSFLHLPFRTSYTGGAPSEAISVPCYHRGAQEGARAGISSYQARFSTRHYPVIRTLTGILFSLWCPSAWFVGGNRPAAASLWQSDSEFLSPRAEQIHVLA